MRDSFQRLLMMAGPEVRALNAQAALGEVRAPERSQFAHLVRHFLERFFRHETSSPDGDAKTRLVQIAFVTGLPPMIVALYLWPVYHPEIQFRREYAFTPPAVPYWLQVNHHFFFAMYSLVALGLGTVFEWDLFFPDLLDMFVLTTLPVPKRRMFRARVSAIAILMGGFLFDANLLAPLVLPSATDPPNLGRFLGGHLAATFCAGLFAATSVLAVQSTLLALLGEGLFRRISLVLQGAAVAVLLLLLLLFPVLSGVTPELLTSGDRWVLWFPPFWFLGIYQRLLEGSAAPPVYAQLATTGCWMTIAAIAVIVGMYPVAYMRRMRQLVEGAPGRRKLRWYSTPVGGFVHAIVARTPGKRAVHHFINQTLLRIPRYRIYLVMYGGVGLSAVVATVLRLSVTKHRIHAEISPAGVRVVIGMIAFWVIAGLRTMFISPGNRQGLWIWQTVQGHPPPIEKVIVRAAAIRQWVMLCGSTVALTALGLLHLFDPAELRSTLSLTAQVVLTVLLCLLLTDLLFLKTASVPFSGEMEDGEENLGFTVLRYFTLLPFVLWLTLHLEHVMEMSVRSLGVAAAVLFVAHLWMRKLHQDHVRMHCIDMERGADDAEHRRSLGLVS